jgi:hypothetical protein
MTRVKDTLSFIAKASIVHADRYTYDRAVYTASRDRITITCEDHGDFTQVAADHVRGVGCPACSGNSKMTTETFIRRAREIHGNRYSYDATEYQNSKKLVRIGCPIHGDFLQTPDSHLSGKGCDACGGTKKKTTAQFVEDARRVHADAYEYDRAVYVGALEKLIITCPTHGDFRQTPNNHLSGFGCAKCAGCATKDHAEFYEQASAIHNDKYTYPDSYVRAKSKVEIVCPIHGPFQQRPADHLHLQQGCPSCWSSRSRYEIEIEDFLIAEGIRVIPTDRKLIAPYEIDLLLPEFNLAIEINGLRFHTDRLKSKTYHYDKWKACHDQGIRLLHVNEDEWLERPTCVRNKILNLCGRSIRGVGARKLKVSKIGLDAAKMFTERYHIQGRAQGISDAFGAFEGEELVAVMTFSIQRGTRNIDLSRFCTNGKIYSGLFSKIFSHAVKENQYNHVVSFADRRYSDGNLYFKSGFKYSGSVPIDYRYVLGKKTFSKRSFTKADIKRRFGIEGSTEREMMATLGYERIYDCGKMRFEWFRP